MTQKNGFGFLIIINFATQQTKDEKTLPYSLRGKKLFTPPPPQTFLNRLKGRTFLSLLRIFVFSFVHTRHTKTFIDALCIAYSTYRTVLLFFLSFQKGKSDNRRRERMASLNGTTMVECEPTCYARMNYLRNKRV